MTKIVMDFDDFCDQYSELDLLEKLRVKNGKGFKVTLFTIPGKSTEKFLQEIKMRYSWIELAVHGWSHDGIGECQLWSKKEALTKLRRALDLGVFVPGFKAPHWLGSKGTYEACQELGLWAAINVSNIVPIPTGLKTYVYGQPHVEDLIQVHGHISRTTGNYIGDNVENYMFGSNFEYKFVSEVVA